MTYIEKLRDFILPKINEKLNECDDIVSGCVFNMTSMCCEELGVADIDELPESIETETDEKVMSIYVLSAVYYLTILGKLKQGDVFVENNGKLGFDTSVDFFADSFEYDGFIDDHEELVECDLTGMLQSALGIEISDCSLDEYFKNRIYFKDLEELEKVSRDMDKEKEEFFEFISNNMITLMDKLHNTYTDLFSSAFQVVKPYGVLTEKGVTTVRTRVINASSSYESFGIYEYFKSKLNFTELPSRHFDVNAIVKQIESGSLSPLYFPYKMIEFVFGCSTGNASNTGTYNKQSSIKTWSAYWKKLISPQLEKICHGVVYKIFENRGYLEDGKYKKLEYMKECKAFLETVTDGLYRNLSFCIITSSWRKVEGKFVGFKFRITDNVHVIPLNRSVTIDIINKHFGGLKGDDDAVCEAVVSVGRSSDYTVVDIQHKFKPTLVNAEPLFAYTALDSQINSGVKISCDSMIIGKLDDDSILSVGKEIRFRGDILKHWILAGSRSGKGVMTLNILAAEIASRKAIFYLDNKPDMCSMFRSASLSGGRMFCINGDYDASFDELFSSSSPEQFGWDKHIPQYVRDVFGSEYLNYTPLFYLRTVMFMCCLLYVRHMVKVDKEKYNRLGGSDGVVCVIDEISAADLGISSMLSKNGLLGSCFYSKNTLAKVDQDLSKGKDDARNSITQFGCYSTDVINSLNETIRKLLMWQQKGLKGGGSEGDVSDFFILGQFLHDVDKTKTEYIPTNDNNMNGTCGDVFMNFLFSFGESDAFMGYNAGRPEYMWSDNVESKAYTRLNASARNFAYVKPFTDSTLATMINNSNGGISSKQIAEDALYFKPFLILNDAKEDSQYVANDFKNMCIGAGLNYDEILNMHRTDGKTLEPAIGFIPYVLKQSGGDVESIRESLAKSYDIANELVYAFIPGYDGDCIDFIYDLRPEAMFTADTLLAAFKTGRHDNVATLSSKYFGSDSSVSGSSDGIDLGDIAEPMYENEFNTDSESEVEPESEWHNYESVVEPESEWHNYESVHTEESPQYQDMYQDMSDEPEEQKIEVGGIIWTHQIRMAVAKAIVENMAGAMSVTDSTLIGLMIDKAYAGLLERGY